MSTSFQLIFIQKILIIGQHFPEPATTAAGVRMMQIIKSFQIAEYEIHFACASLASKFSYPLSSIGVQTHHIQLNDDHFNLLLQREQFNVVLYDRFHIEEQYGWRVNQELPKALTILDTEDIHFLRKAREKAIVSTTKADECLYGKDAIREIAAIYRCDLTLIISSKEMEILQSEYSIPQSILCYFPLCIDNLLTKEDVSFQERNDFMFIGNGNHAPNVDAVKYLHEIWPIIHRHLPKAKLHIYGAYYPQHIQQLHDEKSGFLIQSWVANKEATFKQHRVALYLLRFGAGMKGKIVDAIQFGTPFLTSQIGIEGWTISNDDQQYVIQNKEEFIQGAVELYHQKEIWNRTLKLQQQLAKQLDFKYHSQNFQKRKEEVKNNLLKHRQHNFIGKILHYESFQSNKFKSKWIMAKNQLK